MSVKTSPKRYWKTLSWSLVVVAINLLILLPLPTTLLPLDIETPKPQEPLTGLTLPPGWLFLIILAGFIGVVAIFLWLGGGRFILTMVRFTPSPSVADSHIQAGGIVLTFAVSLSDQDMVIRATLPLLPPASLMELSPSRRPASMGLNLASVEVYASINPHRPEILKDYGAITVPDNINLVGWSKLGLLPHRLTRSVFAGHLTWYDQEEMFARLLELLPGDIIVVSTARGPCYEYRVDKLQHYQADTTSVAKISQTTSEAQLVLIAWSDSYDIDQRVYRDYIVIRAHFAGTLLQKESEMTLLKKPGF